MSSSSRTYQAGYLQYPSSVDEYPADKLLPYRPVYDIPYRMSSWTRFRMLSVMSKLIAAELDTSDGHCRSQLDMFLSSPSATVRNKFQKLKSIYVQQKSAPGGVKTSAYK